MYFNSRFNQTQIWLQFVTPNVGVGKDYFFPTKPKSFHHSPRKLKKKHNFTQIKRKTWAVYNFLIDQRNRIQATKNDLSQLPGRPIKKL